MNEEGLGSLAGIASIVQPPAGLLKPRAAPRAAEHAQERGRKPAAVRLLGVSLQINGLSLEYTTQVQIPAALRLDDTVPASQLWTQRLDFGQVSWDLYDVSIMRCHEA